MASILAHSKSAALPLLIAAVLLAGCGAPNEGEGEAGTSEAALEAGEAIVNVDALNFRAGPSTNDTILAVLSRGDRVHATGENKNGFAAVEHDGRSGWAWTEYLTPAAPTGPAASMAEAVRSIAAEASSRSPGTELGIAVLDLTTGEYAGAGDDVRHVSASSAKAIWVAAAIHAGANVSDIVHPIFENSDNVKAGEAIDRAGGIDKVDGFYLNVVGMSKSLLCNWNYGATRHATNQGVMGGDNYFTPRDVITFLSKLDRGELLGGRTDELRTNMTWSPRTGFGGWLGTLLPADARSSMMHKAGWLPRDSFPDDSTVNDIGIVQVPGGHRYAVALLAHHGTDYAREQSYVERASCVVYRTISRTSIGCRD